MSGCSVSEFLDFLGCHLKDKDHDRWTEKYLLRVIKIAASQVAQSFDDEFKSEHKIKLTPGCKTQTCSQGCENISGPFFNEANGCGRIDEVDIDSDWTSSYFPAIGCEDDADDSEYKVTRVTLDSDNSCYMIVDPPVPDDGKAYFIYAQCDTDINDSIDSGILPSVVCSRLNAFTQLVLHYTYGMDSMVNLDQTQSQTYFNNYLSLVNLEMTEEEIEASMEQARESFRAGVS